MMSVALDLSADVTRVADGAGTPRPVKKVRELQEHVIRAHEACEV
jgi:hypothetical protein